MSEDFDNLAESATTVRPISSRRLIILMIAFVVIASIAGFFYGPARFGYGILVGGVLALANYFWLDRSTRKIFDNAIAGIMPALLAVRYILRYVFLGLILWLVYRTDVVPVVAVIVGMSAFAVAVVIDGIVSIFRSYNRQES